MLLGATMPALAQTYPDKPLRLFSDFPPGVPIDSLTRQIGTELTRSRGQAHAGRQNNRDGRAWEVPPPQPRRSACRRA